MKFGYLPLLLVGLIGGGPSGLLEVRAHESKGDPGASFLSKMVGEWTGRGYRYLYPSGRRVEIEVEVHSSVAGGILESRNHFKETSGNQSREFERVYWIDCRDGDENCVLIYSSGSSLERVPVFYSPEAGLHILQRTGVAGGLSIEITSRTRFHAPGETVYFETVVERGVYTRSETRIHYRRK